jgi:hypothetical protein
MDTLWASLIGLFLIALTVVVVSNLLQGRQTRLRDAWRDTLAARRTTVASAAPDQAGPTVATAGPTARVEPTFGPDPAPVLLDDGAAPALCAHEAIERPVPDPPPRAVPLAAPAPHGAQPDFGPGPVLDPRLDCIIVFSSSAAVGTERVLAAASTLRRAGAKPIAIEVDFGDGRWSLPQASLDAVQRVRAGVLLANRHGPLNAMEFSEFVAAMQGLGRAIGAADGPAPDMHAVLDQARQLDETCARLDAVLGLNVETPTPLSPGELAALAAGLDLHERGNNRFAALGAGGEVLFSLALGERAERLTLLLDVPRAPERLDPWWRMVEAARLCAERTGGQVIDDAGQPMTELAAAGVARQLESCYAALRAAGLDAGSPAALRVFH